MIPSWLSFTLMGVGLLVATIGMIALLITSFRRSFLWGLAVLFVPFGNLIFACMHWAEAKASFLATIAGSVVMCIGIFTTPEATEIFWKAANARYGLQVQPEKKEPDLNAQIQEHRQRLDALQGAFAQDGAELTKQYQVLEAQRKALKPKDAAAIAKFNEAAAAYQARNAARKQMQQQIDAVQRELDTLLDTRSRKAATTAANGKKVVMYGTNHCPACEMARKYFAQKGVRYEEINVEETRQGYEEFKKLGGAGVPLILVGDKKMEGFNAQALDAALM